MISIVLPTYNRLYSIKNFFLPSLNEQSFSDYELIVVNDNSNDNTSLFFRHELLIQYPEIFSKTVYIENIKNMGAPYSRNIGAGSAKGDWIFVVEDDIVIKSKTFLGDSNEILHKVSKDTAVVSPQRYDDLSNAYYKNVKDSFARIGSLSGEIYIDNSQQYTGYVPTTHASSFVRRRIFLEHMKSSELFRGNTFRDETNIYKSITNAGYTILYCGDQLHLLHRNGQAKEGGQKKVNNRSLANQEFMIWSNHLMYLKNYYNFPYIMLFFFILVRALKVFSNTTGLKVLKNMLSLCKI